MYATTPPGDLPDFVRKSMRAFYEGKVVCDHLVEMAEGDARGEGFLFLDMLGCEPCFDDLYKSAVSSGLPYECARCEEMTDQSPFWVVPSAGWRVEGTGLSVILRFCAPCLTRMTT